MSALFPPTLSLNVPSGLLEGMLGHLILINEFQQEATVI
jgi:hypothetical protein